MRFHKIFLMLVIISLKMNGQNRQLEFSLLHEQVTLPWKKLPPHQIHPGVKLSYLTKKGFQKRWLKEVQAGYLVHRHLFRIIHTGYGYRYEILSPKKAFQLQAGASAGAMMLKSTEAAYEIIDNQWKQAEADWKVEGWISVVLKAGYRLPDLPAMHAGAGINIWVQAPHVKQFTTVLPHRNYEIFLRYQFTNNNKTTTKQ